MISPFWLRLRLVGDKDPGAASRWRCGGGPDSAFTTIYIRLPVDGLTLIVLTNQGGLDYSSLLGAIASKLFLRDLIFVLTAIAFMLLLAVLLAAQKNHRVKTTWVTGVVWLLLAVPLTLVFFRSWRRTEPVDPAASQPGSPLHARESLAGLCVQD